MKDSIITLKMRFVNYISEALELDEENGVDRIKFIYRPGREYSDIVEISYKDGHVSKINVHSCSFRTIYKEVWKEVYGDGADGYIPGKDHNV